MGKSTKEQAQKSQKSLTKDLLKMDKELEKAAKDRTKAGK